MAPSPAVNPSRATLLVTPRCHNACLFCAREGLADEGAEAPAREVLRDVMRALAATHDELTLTGGEPTLRDDLDGLIADARAAGFRRVGLQTNGRRLRETGYAAGLSRAGLTDVHLSLHGASSAEHDHHTGVAGSFVESVAGLSSARGAGLTLAVSTVLTRSNFRTVAALAPWLAARGVAAWAVHVPRVAGGAIARFDRVVPRLAMALPAALYALTAARNAALPSWIVGAPLCLLGPHAERSLDDAPRAYAPACATCVARPRCPGVDARYLLRFEADELSAARAPKTLPPATPAHAALARMFTGPGALANDTPEPPHLAARRAPRVSLPVVQEG